MFITKRNKLIGLSHKVLPSQVLGGALWVLSPRPANHCGLEVGEHSPDSSCMREDGSKEEKEGRN